jgi:hypothetical protein
MTSRSIICLERGCKRLYGPKEGDVWVCEAFPIGIPSVVIDGLDLHVEPIEGDEGLLYLPPTREKHLPGGHRQLSHGNRGGNSGNRAENFRRWFGQSHVVDRNGNPLVVYHGTKGNFSDFDVDRRGAFTGANSAKLGFFFTSSPNVSDTYASYAQTDESVIFGPLYSGAADAEAELHTIEHSRAYAETYDDGGWLAKIETADQWGVAYDYDDGNVYAKESDALEAATSMHAEEIAKSTAKLSAAQARLDKKVGELKTGSNIMPVYLSIQNPLEYDFNGGSFVEQSFTELIEDAIADGHDGAIFWDVMDAVNTDEVSDVYIVFDPTQIKSVHNVGTFDPTESDSLKHLAGQHNQKRHGWRYGSGDPGEGRFESEGERQVWQGRMAKRTPVKEPVEKETREEWRKRMFMGRQELENEYDLFAGQLADTLETTPENIDNAIRGLETEIDGFEFVIEDIWSESIRNSPDDEFPMTSTQVQMSIYEKATGASAGIFGVTMGGVFDEAELAVFEVDFEYQHQNIGSNFTQHFERQMQQAGFKNIWMLANMDVGGYAWARLGYDFINSENLELNVKDLSKIWESRYNKPMPDVVKVHLEHSWDIAAVTGPDGHRIGKEVMLGSKWSGQKSLDKNTLSWQIGEIYYASSN